MKIKLNYESRCPGCPEGTGECPLDFPKIMLSEKKEWGAREDVEDEAGKFGRVRVMSTHLNIAVFCMQPVEGTHEGEAGQLRYIFRWGIRRKSKT